VKDIPITKIKRLNANICAFTLQMRTGTSPIQIPTIHETLITRLVVLAVIDPITNQACGDASAIPASKLALITLWIGAIHLISTWRFIAVLLLEQNIIYYLNVL
jgi:hypothetical protein